MNAEVAADSGGTMPAPGPETAPASRGRLFRALAVLRAEDLVLAGWVGLANPLVAHAQSAAGPFDAGQPIEGLVRLAGVAGALICLATRSADRPAGASVLQTGIAGPVVGGLMLVGGSAFAALGFDPGAGIVVTLGAAVVLAGLRGFLPPLPVTARRALITPFVLAAGGIFWSIVRAVTGDTNPGLDLGQLVGALPSVAFPLGVLTAGAAVYYAMLVYAPRQIAEREGGPVVWVFRFALFLASLALGLGWLSLLGG